MMIVDAHLDLAYNALHGREVTQPAATQTPAFGDGTPSVGLPDLKAGNVDLICATIFCEPARGDKPGYKTAPEAQAQANAQYNWYQQQITAGLMDFVHSPADLDPAKRREKLGAILLMEGADPLETAQDVAAWFKKGLRMVGLAWNQTRHAGGTGAPGPLTPSGRDIVRALDAHHIIHDASHLAEESFWQLLELTKGPILASHSNCRAIVPTDRQLSDDMAKALIARGGVIGINFYDKFLMTPDTFRKRPCTLADMIPHIKHLCDLAGNTRHVGLGSDMDGGFGQEWIPQEIKTSADLKLIGDALSKASFSDTDIQNILSQNFLRFFNQHLPN